MTSFTLTIASADVTPRNKTVSLRTILSSPIPSKFNARLNALDETVGTTVGIGNTVGTAVGTGVGEGVAVGTGAEVGVGVGVGVGVDVDVGGTVVAVGNGIDVEAGVAGTGVYRARLSTQPIITNDSKPASTTANFATCTDRRPSRFRVTNIIALRVGYRAVTTR
ncbi:MAG: hypothetical protein HN798_07525 [Chloroflexi bacterium]|nr:hypothetical protein [Chloroflexota bacterium]